MSDELAKNNKIGIAFIIDFLADRKGATGGTERQLIETIKRLDSEVYNPVLICLQDFGNIEHIKKQIDKLYIVDIYRIFSFGSMASICRLVKILKNEKIEIVQTYFQDSNIIGILSARFAGIKNTVACRRDLGFWSGRKIDIVLSIVNNFTKYHLVNSLSVKFAVMENEKVKANEITVINNGMDFSYLDSVSAVNLIEEFPEIEIGDRVVGIVANFTRKVKRHDLFISAAAEIVKSEKQVKFLMVGGGHLESELRIQIETLGLGKYFVFAGVHEQPIRLIKGFDVGVLCSDSEGFSNTLMEYMAAGIPAVATAVGGNTEIIENEVTGLLVPSDNSEKLAEAIKKILNNSAFGRCIGLKGSDFVRSQYDWGQVIEKTQSFYCEMIGG